MTGQLAEYRRRRIKGQIADNLNWRFVRKRTEISCEEIFISDRHRIVCGKSFSETVREPRVQFNQRDAAMRPRNNSVGEDSQAGADFYDALERSRNVLFSRWSLPRDAQRFNTVRLDVMELTEHIDNAIKFVSDIYYARVYRLAARRVGVPDYRTLVDEKLNTAGDLYDFMVDQFNEARSFFLEVCVALLAVLDVIFLLRGR